MIAHESERNGFDPIIPPLPPPPPPTPDGDKTITKRGWLLKI